MEATQTWATTWRALCPQDRPSRCEEALGMQSQSSRELRANTAHFLGVPSCPPLCPAPLHGRWLLLLPQLPSQIKLTPVLVQDPLGSHLLSHLFTANHIFLTSVPGFSAKCEDRSAVLSPLLPRSWRKTISGTKTRITILVSARCLELEGRAGQA